MEKKLLVNKLALSCKPNFCR